MYGLIDMADIQEATDEQIVASYLYELEKEKLQDAEISDTEYYRRLKMIANELGI